ncbi:hypothetical protein [Myceligenerans indicum]|uniref:hypothetical protein n=1 Tax=Myceligenerans indicum TaxID=2593663 RepID=UPI00191CBF3C|nr:hypothetical protein [Myceligenerans indicum]
MANSLGGTVRGDVGQHEARRRMFHDAALAPERELKELLGDASGLVGDLSDESPLAQSLLRERSIVVAGNQVDPGSSFGLVHVLEGFDHDLAHAILTLIDRLPDERAEIFARNGRPVDLPALVFVVYIDDRRANGLGNLLEDLGASYGETRQVGASGPSAPSGRR